MHKKGSDKRFLGNKDSFILLTPVGTSKGPENVDTGLGWGSYIIIIGSVGENGVESNSQYAGCSFQRQ